MGEMLQGTLVLEDSLNGQFLAICAVNISYPSQLCSLLFCTALPAAVGRQEQLGDSHRELIKPALLTEECLLNQALSVLKLCMGIRALEEAESSFHS